MKSKTLLTIMFLLTFGASMYYGIRYLFFGNLELVRATGMTYVAISYFVLKTYLDFMTKETKDNAKTDD